MAGQAASRRWLKVSVAAGIALAFQLGSRSVARPSEDRTDLPVNRGLMQRLGNFTLKDVTNGQDRSLYALRGSRAIVLVFIGTDCPVGNQYVPRLIELNREYQPKGVIFFGISSNAHDSAKDVAKYVHDMGIDFPVLKDLQNKVADSGLVERTPEVLVLDGAARVRFHGAIDDQFKVGKPKSTAAQNSVRNALDALLADTRSKSRRPRSRTPL